MVAWLDFASHLKQPLSKTLQQATRVDLLLWLERRRQVREEELHITQREDYRFARLGLEIARLRHSMTAKKGRRFKGKLKDFVVKFDKKGKQKQQTQKQIKEMTPQEYEAAKKKAAFGAKSRWFRALGMDTSILKKEYNRGKS